MTITRERSQSVDGLAAPVPDKPRCRKVAAITKRACLVSDLPLHHEYRLERIAAGCCLPTKADLFIAEGKTLAPNSSNREYEIGASDERPRIPFLTRPVL